MNTQEMIRDNFAKNLKAEDYFTQSKEDWINKAPEIFRFFMCNIDEVFRSERFKGSKLLEIGSGATVHNIATASAYFPNIIMSDYVEDNIDHLKRWLRGESKLKQLLEIPAELEGYSSDLDAGIKVLEARIRKAVKGVYRCDATIDGILMDKPISVETAPPFDMIISCLCLEAAPKDLEEYFKIYKRINALLKPGGGLFVCGFFQGSYWKVIDTWFNYVKFAEEDLQHALTQAGFGKINMKTMSKDDIKILYEGYEYEKIFCVSAEKL